MIFPTRSVAARLASTLAATTLATCAFAAPVPIEKPSDGPKPADTKKITVSPVLSGDKLRMPKGFRADLIYSIPRETQGSWVNLAVDPKGRIIASDQYGKLYRVTPSPLEVPSQAPKVEPINVEIGEAQGLLWAFDSLYVVVNSGGKFPSGLYRVKDLNGDGDLDHVEKLRAIEGTGEHGPHAIVLAPDGKSLYVVAGNATKLPELSGTLVPKVWGEDNLLPRMPDGNGFMRDEKAPGGFICRIDPDGKDWVLESMGYRNAFDIAFNRYGDLFTFDSDMEWDMNTPWYRPTRVCQAASGADFGYRNGAGKWPTYYFDSLPPVVNIGPGSPTGITFGYKAKFPQKYQDALFLCDWSYGKLYAAHIRPAGSTYKADFEEFITGAPLPLTDIVVNPLDGAMYFATGGRKVSSGLYRITYSGEESTEAVTPGFGGAEDRALRRSLEAFHGHLDPEALAVAWPMLDHPDRFIRNAARVAVEFQDSKTWRDRALAESRTQASLEALLALAQVSAVDPAHRVATSPKPDPADASAIYDALDRIDWSILSHQQRLDLVRVEQIVLNRFGKPDDVRIGKLIAKFDAIYPSASRELNVELANLMIFLEAPSALPKTLGLLGSATTQDEQLEYGRALRVIKGGWNPDQRKAYFTWIARTSGFKGGPSLKGFLGKIRQDALEGLTEQELSEAKAILETHQPDVASANSSIASVAPRAFVKAWTLDELVPAVEEKLQTKRDFNKGRSLFAAGNCSACHRYNDEGGAVGPDLSGVAGRFSMRDLLESIVLPSKVISDQYGAVTISTTDGKVVTGRIMNLHGDSITLNTNMLDPSAQVNINASKIEENVPSTVSMMPEGLLSTMTQDEVADLIAYLLSRGDSSQKMFR